MHKKCQIRLLEEKSNQSERGIMPDKVMYTEKEKIFPRHGNTGLVSSEIRSKIFIGL